ncbi:outer membrane beta-barrel protein [Sphingomonas sp. LY54]|uniref:outer membrane beta-barrel protein n=1 Tax=Sphingomonas sp. LY54 TaxID=3095343 RepID=UPI002D79C3CE|nr:outer membrane beta-barrel protein [Sphingomonas sp. LY54]WRP27741.1 outer membrane beta-barrel protein [Sphingomonas sp. LY54]
MKRFILPVAAAVLATGAASSAAAEPFNGPYVGVQGGWSQNDLGSPSTPQGIVNVDRSDDAVSGGVYTGYDLKVSPRVVLGAEAGVQFGANDSITRGNVTVDPKRSIDLTARAGYLVNDDTLLYARGGYTNTRVRTAIEEPAGIRSATANRDGWLVGGGVEHALSDNVSARAEYRYSDLGDGGGKFDRHQALFGISYRF